MEFDFSKTNLKNRPRQPEEQQVTTSGLSMKSQPNRARSVRLHQTPQDATNHPSPIDSDVP